MDFTSIQAKRHLLSVLLARNGTVFRAKFINAFSVKMDIIYLELNVFNALKPLANSAQKIPVCSAILDISWIKMAHLCNVLPAPI
jgi:hypothetical protein